MLYLKLQMECMIEKKRYEKLRTETALQTYIQGVRPLLIEHEQLYDEFDMGPLKRTSAR